MGLATKSIVRPRSAVAAQLQRRHLPDRLDRYAGAHLGCSHLALPERDRHLHHREARLDRVVGELDLESVAVSVHLIDVDSLEYPAVEALEAAREVANRDAEDVLRVPAAAAARHPAQEAPVAHAAAAHIG